MLIAVELAGLCGSDVALFQGDHPTDFVKAIELVRSRVFTPSALVSRVAPLEAVADLLHGSSRQPGKVLLDVCGAC